MSGFFDKLKMANELLAKNGFPELIEKLFYYIRYNLNDKWRFIYFELDLTIHPYSLPDMGESMVMRRAQPVDILKIKNDLYPYMGKNQEFDKRYIDQIGNCNHNCFIAEVDNKIVHYFMVFNTATNSPIMQTPFDKQLVREKDAYLGNAFTIPDARGRWIVPYIILSIMDYLREETTATRALLLVHRDTPGAVGFFSRLGFNVIEDAYPNSILSRFLTSLSFSYSTP